MGLRGKGARVPTYTSGLLKAKSREPWKKPGLTRAERVIAFVESLNITSGIHAGKKFTLRPWQKKIVHAWYAENRQGERIVRTGLLTLARKNGKTSLCAALALAHLVGPEVERRGQVIAAATDRDQAGLIYDELVAFILDNPVFVGRTNIQRFAKTIEDLPSGTKFRALSSEAAKAHGLNPSILILDELAQWGHTEPGKRLYDALTTATGARKDPLTFVISTQTPDATSLMTQLVEYGREVLAGRITDPAFSAHIFETPLDGDPWDEARWVLANPALGDFRSLEEMQNFAERAKKMPAAAAAFKAFYLNQPIGTRAKWLDVAAWDEGATTREWPAAGRRVYLGLDLASTRDLCSLACWFPAEDGTWDLRIESWCPRGTIEEHTTTDRVPYQQWVDEGWLRATPGTTTDFGFIEKRVYELAQQYQVVELGCDQWNARDLLERFSQNNVAAVIIPQTIAQLTAPSKEFERLILERKLRHDGSPLNRWAVDNVIALVDSNENIKPDKRARAPHQRIDPVTAAITGLARALVLVQHGPSVYESRGVMTA